MSKKSYMLVVLGLFCSNKMQSIDLSNFAYPYSALLKLLPYNSHGWYNNAAFLQRLIEVNNLQQIIEVGSWLGKSTCHIASLLPKNGKVYAVDTWEGSVEHVGNPNVSHMLPTLYEQFLSNVIHKGLADKIIPLQTTSQEAAVVFKNKKQDVDLIYLDAAHDYDSVFADLQAYFPLVKGSQGILSGDDWSWRSSSDGNWSGDRHGRLMVREAVIDFAKQNELTVYGDDNFWFIKEEGSFAVKSFKNASKDVWKFDLKG